MNSTPCRLVEIIRLTALLPPPPTPITLMLAPTALVSSKEIRGALFGSRSSMEIISTSPGCVCWLKELVPPDFDHVADAGQQERVRRPGRHLLALAETVQRQSHRRAVLGRADRIRQAADLGRRAAPHRSVEDVLGDLGEAFEHRAAAGQDHPGMDRAGAPAPPER